VTDGGLGKKAQPSAVGRHLRRLCPGLDFITGDYIRDGSSSWRWRARGGGVVVVVVVCVCVVTANRAVILGGVDQHFTAPMQFGSGTPGCTGGGTNVGMQRRCNGSGTPGELRLGGSSCPSSGPPTRGREVSLEATRRGARDVRVGSESGEGDRTGNRRLLAVGGGPALLGVGYLVRVS
jgi:hypothetical protein